LFCIALSLFDLSCIGLTSIGRANMCDDGQDKTALLFSTSNLDGRYARKFAETLPVAFDRGDSVIGSSVYHVVPYLANASSKLRTLPSTYLVSQ
jgi:hypothetical protein